MGLLFLESLPLAMIVFICFGRAKSRPMLALVLVACLSTVLPGDAHAQVHKCVDSAGRTEYREAPCAADARGGQINVQANTSDGQAVERAQLRSENERLRDRLHNAESYQQPQGGVGRTQADLASQAGSSQACQQARRSYETAASSIAPNKADIAARRSAMHGACGTIEPPITEVTVIKQAPPLQRECLDARDWNCVQKLPRR
ncbi:MAG: DUF4124 domain-containing protein [Burkholderiales bacterium]|nr:DUF4124 domain-containing protein [Burkholderiales bacterium]